MPPMATSSAKRKWSDVFGDRDICDKQSIMDLCTTKLRYVNPARPPRRRTEVPLLRNVLIVNTMKHLSAEMKTEKQMEYNNEDLSVDPGHFEGLPPLSELLTDIMLDPQPIDQQQQSVSSFGWTSTGGPPYATPLEPSIPSYMDTSDGVMEGGDEEKIVHDLLPCTSVMGMNPAQHSTSWDTQGSPQQHSSNWQVNVSSAGHHSPSWDAPCDPSVLDCFLSSASIQPSPSDSLDTLASDLAFQSSSTPLPSFTSLFESHHSSSFTELLPTSTLQGPTSSSTISPSSFMASTSASFPTIGGTSTEDLIGSVNLTESELEILLAMTVSSRHMSFEDLVQALPLQQSSQPSQSFYVPSSLQSSVSPGCENSPAANNQCSSYCRNDQPPPSVDESSMVRVLVNL
ncbi:unnamed protein product [Lymnaea stagnalis]|uniref:SERTA domain-containing protein n=1 Tax=Lymnaea stagnalis TaxID=6523 RepID=A0AAV2H278_LYMST